MKKVDVATLIPGCETQFDYYNERGDLLISKGVIFTPRHLEMLQRRNVFELYIKPANEDEELERLLSFDMKGLAPLNIDDHSHSKLEPKVALPSHAKALLLPEFAGIKKGKDGLSQLLSSSVSVSLDNNIATRTTDRPVGVALAKKSSQVTVAQRTLQDKTSVSVAYSAALAEVTRVINNMADGMLVSTAEIRRIVQQFVKIFITDHNILLNISGYKHKGQSYIYNHSLNVCLLSINIAAAEGFNEQQIIEIGMGALVHDVGMLLVSPGILEKTDRLIDEEWYEVQKHPIIALHLLERIQRLPETVPFVAYQVHERENRTGYPKQRGSNLIHPFAKIVQVADVFEAMSSPRPYRAAHIPYKAMENVIKMTRSGLLGGDTIEAFLRYVSLFPVGSLVELSDKRIAKVVDANSHAFAKPQVSVLTDCGGGRLAAKDVVQIDLSAKTDVYITRALPMDYLAGTDLMDGF